MNTRLITEPQLIASKQILTDAYADIGAEIDCRYYDTVGVWVNSDVNSSENVSLKALGKHTASGADEYEIDGVSVKTLWTTGASDSKKYYEFEVDAIHYLQLQVIAGTVGATAGTITIEITKKGWEA